MSDLRSSIGSSIENIILCKVGSSKGISIGSSVVSSIGVV